MVVRTVFAMVAALWGLELPAVFAADPASHPQNLMMCGTCPTGYARTGVTSDAKVCKEGDPTLVECVRVGANILAVCGACPDGYVQVGASSVPARCGSEDGGRMSQCQLSRMEGGVFSPGKGGISCPPNCAGPMPTPGKGAFEPPSKVRPAPEETR